MTVQIENREEEEELGALLFSENKKKERIDDYSGGRHRLGGALWFRA